MSDTKGKRVGLSLVTSVRGRMEWTLSRTNEVLYFLSEMDVLRYLGGLFAAEISICKILGLFGLMRLSG